MGHFLLYPQANVRYAPLPSLSTLLCHIGHKSIERTHRRFDGRCLQVISWKNLHKVSRMWSALRWAGQVVRSRIVILHSSLTCSV